MLSAPLSCLRYKRLLEESQRALALQSRILERSPSQLDESSVIDPMDSSADLNQSLNSSAGNDARTLRKKPSPAVLDRPHRHYLADKKSVRTIDLADEQMNDGEAADCKRFSQGQGQISGLELGSKSQNLNGSRNTGRDYSNARPTDELIMSETTENNNVKTFVDTLKLSQKHLAAQSGKKIVSMEQKIAVDSRDLGKVKKDFDDVDMGCFSRSKTASVVEESSKNKVLDSEVADKSIPANISSTDRFVERFFMYVSV